MREKRFAALIVFVKFWRDILEFLELMRLGLKAVCWYGPRLPMTFPDQKRSRALPVCCREDGDFAQTGRSVQEDVDWGWSI